MITFKEWFKQKECESIDLKESLESEYFFESFDTHYDIKEIKKVDVFTFYVFNVNDDLYRIFIEDMPKYDTIYIGFDKYNYRDSEWRIKGIDNELKNGEVQKIFGTIIYVVKDLYKGNYNNILFSSKENKKFRIYLRIATQISEKLIPDSYISHDDKEKIFIHKKDSKTKIKDIKTKHKGK